MTAQTRPSGAAIEVLKTFTDAADCHAQFALMVRAGENVAVQPRVIDAFSFAMPLERAEVPRESFFDLLAIYERLWRLRGQRVCGRSAYHVYVRLRAEAATTNRRTKSILSELVKIADARYEFIKELPVLQAAFVHGDAIVSNAVMTAEGPRLIDFSPRESPGEREIDVAKLQFSALGFDLKTPKQRAELFTHLLALINAKKMSRELLLYYLTTHAIRVFSKEPPRTLERTNFFEGVLDHVCD